MGQCGSVCVGVRGGGLEGCIFCGDNLHYGFSCVTLNPVCLLIIISLNAFDVALMFLFTFFSLSILAELP